MKVRNSSIMHVDFAETVGGMQPRVRLDLPARSVELYAEEARALAVALNDYAAAIEQHGRRINRLYDRPTMPTISMLEFLARVGIETAISGDELARSRRLEAAA